MAIRAESSSCTLDAAGKLNPQVEDIPGMKTLATRVKPREIRVTGSRNSRAVMIQCIGDVQREFPLALSLSAKVDKRTPDPRL